MYCIVEVGMEEGVTFNGEEYMVRVSPIGWEEGVSKEGVSNFDVMGSGVYN